jgi:hypothetical protein
VGGDGSPRIVSSGGESIVVWRLVASGAGVQLSEERRTPLPVTDVFQKGFFTSVSSNGTLGANAIIWAVQRPTATPPALTLFAVDAATGSVLYSAPAGDWPNTGGAANVVPVVANGRVYVASYKAVRSFGILSGPKNASAARASSKATLPELAKVTAHESVIYGTVAEVNATQLWLRTRTDVVTIDVADVQQKELTVPLVLGKAVRVEAHVDADRHVTATEIEHAPDSPSLWTDEKR